MDKIDRKILSLLQENARYPLKYLAQKVFLSSPAVSTRIERMEKAGIITGYHATIDPVALGYHITAFINLTLDPKQKNEFYPYVTDCPNVLECNCVTGTYSIMLKVAFPSTMELDTFIGHLQQFGNTQTQIVFSTAVPPRGVGIETDETDTAEEIMTGGKGDLVVPVQQGAVQIQRGKADKGKALQHNGSFYNRYAQKQSASLQHSFYFIAPERFAQDGVMWYNHILSH